MFLNHGYEANQERIHMLEYLTQKCNAVFNLMSFLLFSIYYSMVRLIATNLASELRVINGYKSTLTNLISNTEVISCLCKLFIEELHRFIHSYSSGASETPPGTPVESVAFSKVLPGAKFTRKEKKYELHRCSITLIL